MTLNDVMFMVSFGINVAVVIAIIRSINSCIKVTRAESAFLGSKVDELKSLLLTANGDMRAAISVRALILQKYGVQLSVNDILTLLIQWGKRIETSEDFVNFVDEYLKEKKWLYS